MILRAMLAVVYATGRTSHAIEVKGEDPDKKGYPGLPGWGLGVRLTAPPHNKILLGSLGEKRGQDPPRAVQLMMIMMMMMMIY